MHHKRHGGQQTLQALTRTRGGAKQGIKQRAPPIRRMLPVMLLAMLSLYGIWFFRAATENRDPAVPGVRSDEEGPRIVAQAAAVEEGARIVAKAAAVSPPRPPAPQALSAGTAATAASAHLPVTAAGSPDCSLSASSSPTQARVASFNGEQWMDVKMGAESIETAAALTITAWVLLDTPPFGEPASIQTIVASKHSGCDANTLHHGISLFANAWNTNSGQLFVSWGNRRSGCEELSSSGRVLEPRKWAFVSASFTADGAAHLAVNGKVVAHSRRKLGAAKVQGDDWAVDRLPGTTSMRIGAHPDGTHALHGFVAQLAVWDAELSEEQLGVVMRGCKLGLQPVVSAPFVGRESQKSAEAADVTVTRAGAHVVLPTTGGAETPALVALSVASEKGREQVERGRQTSRARSALTRGGGGGGGSVPPGAKAADGWPLTWLPPRTLRFTDAAKSNESEMLALSRKEHVRGVMKRAWSAYRKYAWGADEIKPVSNRSHNWLHLGATLVDCLDNLWLMELKEEFAEAREWVATRLNFDRASSISMFETIIRIMGGLLSAFELSKDRMFLDKSRQLADKMMYAFNRNPTGLPCTTISLSSQSLCSHPAWAQNAAILAEFGTIQLEFKYLAHHTGERRYWDVADRIMQLMQKSDKPHGLFPTFMNPKSGRWSSGKITFGALGDSFYEYLIKQFLITRKKETYLRDMWEETMLSMARLLVRPHSQ